MLGYQVSQHAIILKHQTISQGQTKGNIQILLQSYVIYKKIKFTDDAVDNALMVKFKTIVMYKQKL